MGKIIDYINTNLDIGEEYEEIFHKSIPRAKMFCPFHTNTNTPAAKRYGNVIHCFSCNRSYTVYDLLKKFNPKKIEEIKTSIVLPDSSESFHKRIKILKLDRTKSIYDLVEEIVSAQ